MCVSDWEDAYTWSSSCVRITNWTYKSYNNSIFLPHKENCPTPRISNRSNKPGLQVEPNGLSGQYYHHWVGKSALPPQLRALIYCQVDLCS